MSTKLLEATCDAAGVVSAEGAVIPEAEVLSEGKQSSAGVVLIEKDKAKYITSSSSDLKTLIGKLTDTITDIAAALTTLEGSLTSIAAVAGPSWTSPPTLATDVTSLAAKVADLNAIKTSLTTLKGALK